MGILSGVSACLFDFDGTLVVPSIDFDQMRLSVLELVREFGVDPLPLAGMHVLEMIEHVTTRLPDGGRQRASDFCRRAHRSVLDIELEAAESAEPYPGAPEMLVELSRRGFKVAIVTRNCRAAVERIMERVPMHCDVLLTRDDVSHVKPDPRHLYAALEVIDGSPDRTNLDGSQGAQVGTAQNAMMCGDHPMDIVAGKRIGAHTVGVLRPGVSTSYFDDVMPDLILDDISHLLDLLDHPAPALASGGASDRRQ